MVRTPKSSDSVKYPLEMLCREQKMRRSGDANPSSAINKIGCDGHRLRRTLTIPDPTLH
jgi:hypothetical protein